MKAYKLFRVRNGKLYPLYIYANDETPIGEYVPAREGIRTDENHVKARKFGQLALRAGWHSCELPYVDHIGVRQPDGSLAKAKDTVWCEIEISDSIDYTKSVEYRNKNGIVVPKKSCRKEIPYDGFYYYQTNPKAKVRWLISGAIKVNKILTDEEVRNICEANGIKAQEVVA